jgi:hypothetical protein
MPTLSLAFRGYGPDSGVELSSSPGGKEENTGAVSKFRDKLTTGTVAVIWTEPVKSLRPRN